jgi:predicted nucleic acid-binding protein
MLVVDTTVWENYFNGQINPETNYFNHAISEELILVSGLILAETLQGFHEEKDFKLAQAALSKFEQTGMFNFQLAQQSAQYYRTLRKKGITVRKTIDCLIATFCIAENHTLLHRDSDFDGFEKHLSLNVVHPA